MSTTIEDRVILLLLEKSGESQNDKVDKPGVVGKIKSALVGDEPKRWGRHGFWENLDRYTGISAQRWRKAYARRQRPTPDMIEALAKMFPAYAFWLATGITDATNGHIAPLTAQTFPERLYSDSMETNSYFRAELALLDKLFEEGKVNLSEDKERMYAAERTRPLAHWWDSALCNVAYQIARSEEYEHLKTLWTKREEERNRRIKYISNSKPEDRPWVIARNKDKLGGVNDSPFLGIDPRTRHQDHWDLFYQPKDSERTKFALSVLNIPPAELTDDQLNAIAGMSLHTVEEYLTHHEIDKNAVFPFKGGVIRYSDEGLFQEEVERLRALAMKQRENNSGN